jgi:uncharacterized protein YehS (DUF1456 family)
MVNNDVLRSLRFLLKANNAKIMEIFELAGILVTPEEVFDFLRNEEDPERAPVPDEVMAGFLDGVVYFKRGKDPSRPAPELELPVSNNLVMKKLRVAFQLREEDMLGILEGQGFAFGKAQLSAILRKRGHPNYRECGDQVLRNFLKGLAARGDAS